MEGDVFRGSQTGRLGFWRRFLVRRRKIGPGPLGEWIALHYLNSLKWDLLARNWVSRRGEVDLIGYDGDCLVFVEVKCRRADGLPPEENFSPEKLQKLEDLMWEFQLRHELFDHPSRLDLIAVTLSPEGRYELRHYTL